MNTSKFELLSNLDQQCGRLCELTQRFLLCRSLGWNDEIFPLSLEIEELAATIADTSGAYHQRIGKV